MMEGDFVNNSTAVDLVVDKVNVIAGVYNSGEKKIWYLCFELYK